MIHSIIIQMPESWPEALYRMLRDGDPNIVSYSEDGKGFYIRSKKEFEKPGGVLEQFFPGAGSGYSAFSRSCSNYFMASIPAKDCPLPMLGHYHKFGIFHRDHPERLKYVFNKNQLKDNKNFSNHMACMYSIKLNQEAPAPDLDTLIDASDALSDEQVDALSDEQVDAPAVDEPKYKFRIKKYKETVKKYKKKTIKYKDPTNRNHFVAMIAMISTPKYIDDDSIKSLKIVMNNWLMTQPEYIVHLPTEVKNDNIMKE
jgi:hypothetical protein